jgi:mono/diheme cytochrome c family protein
MKTLITLAIVVIVGLMGAIGFAYSGLYDVGASSPHSGFVNWLLSTTSHASVERRARDIEVPNLEAEALQLAGVNDFNGMCAGCHGAPGQDPEAMGQGLNPPAPDLAESAKEMTPAELFWVTKNGIKMTGMPAWGATHDDDALWPVVALLQKLPDLDAAGYQALLADAEGIGHHAEDVADDGHAHASADHASNDADHDVEESDGHQHDESEQRDDAPQVQEEHDHSTHEH